MDWITGIQRAIDYVEDHLADEIDYEEAAARSFSSGYHFQRVFSILCGYTLGEYIRMRRLTLAGAELVTTGEKVIDIAAKYGYDSPDSFTRAFQKFHGITPSEARRTGCVQKSFSRLSIKLSLEGGTIMNYRIEEKEAMILTGYKRKFTGIPGNRMEQEEQMYVTTRALQYMLSGVAGNLETDYNVICNVDDTGYDFWIASQLSDFCRDNLAQDSVLGAEYAKHFENIAIPKCTYAVFETERCTYPTGIFLELRQQIVSQWLPGSGYRLAEAPELVVTHWYRDHRRDQRYRELWLPIEAIN